MTFAIGWLLIAASRRRGWAIKRLTDQSGSNNDYAINAANVRLNPNRTKLEILAKNVQIKARHISICGRAGNQLLARLAFVQRDIMTH